MDLAHVVMPHRVVELRQTIKNKIVYLSIKRIIDIFSSLILIVIFLPLMLIVYLTIKLTSSGPAIFKQERLGLLGKPFTIYKFRSMYYDEKNDLEYFIKFHRGTFTKSKDDPRLTPFGKYIRKTSIDELPQLFNILIGDMSFVGPRPVLDFQITAYPYLHELRNVVKPGLTGYWQIKNRRNGSTIFDMIDYDLEYINNLS
ncbi:MAG: sugar transferase, partial [Candidatus Kapaibacterium sp.]